MARMPCSALADAASGDVSVDLPAAASLATSAETFCSNASSTRVASIATSVFLATRGCVVYMLDIYDRVLSSSSSRAAKIRHRVAQDVVDCRTVIARETLL